MAGTLAMIVPTAGYLNKTRAMWLNLRDGDLLKFSKQGQKMKVNSQKIMMRSIWIIDTSTKRTM
jgi:hypothetical protein